MPADTMERTVTRQQVEDFLFHEAALLDDWKLDDWLALYTRDCAYEVPSPEMTLADSAKIKLFLIADDFIRLEQRVIRLKKKTAHAEWPNPQTLHQVTNVQLLDQDAAGVRVRSAFSVFRTKDSVTTHFIGYCHHTLLPESASFKIRSKRCHFALNSLRNQGKLGILL